MSCRAFPKSLLSLLTCRNTDRPTCVARADLRQTGSGMVEFTIVALPLIFLGFAAFESARWFAARHILSVALQEAGRAAIVAHGHPAVIHAAFEQALQPLRVLESRAPQARNAPVSWKIEILSPSRQVFRDFSDKRLGSYQRSHARAINNHYLAEQHARYRARGWPGGRGPISGKTIFEANVLTLRLHYPLKPIVPGVSALLRTLGQSDGRYSERALQHGYLPLVREISFVMQSHPVLWPWPEGGQVQIR